jgi:hypothetical protein
VANPDRFESPGKAGQIDTVVEVVKEYAVQETLGPVKGAGKWLAFGAAGAACVGIGCALLVLGFLRMLQTESAKTFAGSWVTIAPYFFALIATLFVMTFAAWRISKKKTLQKGGR